MNLMVSDFYTSQIIPEKNSTTYAVLTVQKIVKLTSTTVWSTKRRIGVRFCDINKLMSFV